VGPSGSGQCSVQCSHLVEDGAVQSSCQGWRSGLCSHLVEDGAQSRAVLNLSTEFSAVLPSC
jgi:hypothetical protein